MFVLCFQITNNATIKLIKKYECINLPREKNIKIGSKIAAEILDKETNLVFVRTIKKYQEMRVQLSKKELKTYLIQLQQLSLLYL